jgi:DNA helicase II / ATP-dependent DNA helicase PcrA
MTISALELAKLLNLPEPTAEQQDVIEAPLGPAVVIAGAGSGKTETMAARVVWLAANGVVPPAQVLGLTFTRRAAAELTSRIRRRLAAWARYESPEQRAVLGEDPTVLTYAAYAARLVADHGLRIGVEPSARLISPAVAWQLADAVVRRYDGDLPEDLGVPGSVTKWVLLLAGQLADHLASPAAVRDLETELVSAIDRLPLGQGLRNAYPTEVATLIRSLHHRSQLLPLVEGYMAAKRALGAVDFADQMVSAARLAGLPEVGAAERSRCATVLLDEYQDTGHAQVATLHGLFGAGHPVTAVGDPFQSIYSWRGASSGNILRFPTDFASNGQPVRIFPLPTSWRNDEGVLSAANAVAAPLRAISPGAVELRSSPLALSGRVVVRFESTVEAEAEWLAEKMSAAWAALAAEGNHERTAAVLVRRRSDIAAVAAALTLAGLPVEVVDLGGLLLTPEVVDVVATLRVLADEGSGAALLRLLTGARWSIGPRDLGALAHRATALANPDGVRVQGVRGSIVEALDDLGNPALYSAAGYERMARLADELRHLRRRLSAPLPELVGEIERVTGLTVEVEASRHRARVGRRHLDRFLDEAARFALEADQATLPAFLAFLDAAEDEQYGLPTGEVEVDAERVQILTVHGAKGLEWDLVAIPGLVTGVFPSKPVKIDWTRAREVLPSPLRGDRADLPSWTVEAAADRREVRDRLNTHAEEVKQRHLLEERRLAYVALTRARHTVFASGSAWADGTGVRQPSELLTDLTPYADVTGWFGPQPGEENPRLAEPRTATWPVDPLGSSRADVEHAAELVRSAAVSRTPVEPTPWSHDVDLLLRERTDRRPGEQFDVPLPGQLSVSALVALREDPAWFARRLRRPVPLKPKPLARRGTAFHLWLEQRWAGERLLDVDELPGAQDAETGADADFEALRAAFEASRWANLTPAEVEVPFEMVIAGVVVRGRMDAVFFDPDDDPDLYGPRWLVVDWKTGAVPTGDRKRAAAVQLAAYRIAWAALADVPHDQLYRVRAAFHYVRPDQTVEPVDLLDIDGLRELISASGG